MKQERWTPRERLDAVFAFQRPDRTPVLGGWIACPEHIMKIAGVDEETYWAEPREVSFEAYRQLGTDGLLAIVTPLRRGDYRIVDRDSYARSDKGRSLAEALAEIDAMPTPEQTEDEFDSDAAYEEFRRDLLDGQTHSGEMVWMPAQWGTGAKVGWYGAFGYENFFLIVAAHEKHARKLMEVGGARGRLRAQLLARAVREGVYPRAVLLGEDICTQRGPMISPKFMEKYYFPELKRGLEPIIEAGCRPVWHSDGDVRALLPMLFDAGIKGLQGFQPECGLDIDTVSRMKTRDGEPLVIFGPLAVTTELPVCTPEEVRAKTRHAIDVCRESGAALCLFTANTINPDVPLENILAIYEAAREEP